MFDILYAQLVVITAPLIASHNLMKKMKRKSDRGSDRDKDGDGQDGNGRDGNGQDGNGRDGDRRERDKENHKENEETNEKDKDKEKEDGMENENHEIQLSKESSLVLNEALSLLHQVSQETSCQNYLTRQKWLAVLIDLSYFGPPSCRVKAIMILSDLMPIASPEVGGR